MKIDTFDTLCEKRVSYILPTKNRAKTLDNFLNNFRKIKKPEDEFIILDGESTDNTKEVIKNYPDLVDMFVSEKDINCTHAVNKGLLIAKGKYIKTLSDDDIYHPEAMQQAIQILESNPEIDMLVCGGTKEKDGTISYLYIPSGVDYGRKIEDVFKYGRCGVGHFFKRSALANVGLFPSMVIRESGEVVVHADAEYLLKFISSGATVRFCRLNVFHHPHSDYDRYQNTDNYWQDAVRRYASRNFYRKYYIRMKIRPVLKTFRFIRKLIRRKAPITKKLLDKKKVDVKQDYIWDGGFS